MGSRADRGEVGFTRQHASPGLDLWIVEPASENPVTLERLCASLSCRADDIEPTAVDFLNATVRQGEEGMDKVVEVACKGGVRQVLLRTMPIQGETPRVAVAMQDATTEEALRDALRRTHRQLRELQQNESVTRDEALALALNDTLTGLPNRRAFDAELAAASISGGFALCLLDMDHFKDVNDALGHAIGDRLLKAVGNKLHRVTRETDFVSRLAGDEFAIILYGVDTIQSAQDATNRILNTFTTRLDLGEVDLQARLTAGIALGKAGDDPGRVYRQADMALHSAKSVARGSAMVHTSASPSLLDHDDLVIVKALLGDSPLPLRAEPIIDDKLKLIGHEIIAGGQSFERMLGTAMRFNLGEDLLTIILRQLCEAAARLRECGTFVRIRMPHGTAEVPEAATRVLGAMAAASLPSHGVSFEIPLAAFGRSNVRALADTIGHAGVPVALGDWDPGIAAHQRVQSGAFSTVTIDAEATMTLIGHIRLRTVWRASIAALREEGIAVHARNVSNAAFAPHLFDIGVAAVQGPVFTEHYRDACKAAAALNRAA
ncbi:GGDEF domain-containing protein [Acuticoccus kandeliae]|uniref:GGDEF domain-containing protein n=1 Tax=Acuticoccus kandeliae TaxID=2073160 RepID=UPI001473361B|nr:diguanylate cyclase [Acuticoccus kandeliae]